MGDFETTVYDGQEYTEVWASACVELNTDDVQVFHSLQEQFDYLVSLKSNIIIYYHNLKFDGSFWLPFLIDKLGYKQAYYSYGKGDTDIKWEKDNKMNNHEFKYMISERGMWYSITIKVNNKYIQIRDSYKLIPFSVRDIGKSFKTKHKKLDMEYKGFRYAGCVITDEEKEYIKNDVLVVKEALEIMFSEGHDKLTIGSCCLSEYKRICKVSVKNQLSYDEMFPDVYKILLDDQETPNAGEWIRKSYKGGWCYLVKGKECKVYHDGLTADVNSLYPSMMHSMSGNRYPIGNPCFWQGDFIPEEALGDDKYYFVKVKTRFYLKSGYLPFIQIKSSFLYEGTECLETSDVKLYRKDGTEYYATKYTDYDGIIKDTRVTLTLTMTDYILMQEHYDLVEFEILEGCYFYAVTGIFDEYIDIYKEKKQNSTGALRTLAKLFLNNLYGKMASSSESSFKLAQNKEDGVLGFTLIEEYDKQPGYIPVGSAITSYSRNFTIRTAQANYHGPDKPGFIYADTDSIHCDLPLEKLKGVKTHDSEFCCWKIESLWDTAFYTRQKTYIEHVTHEDLKPIDKPYYLIKCAGMPDKCKKLFEMSLTGKYEDREYTKDETDFLYDEKGEKIKRELGDFTEGLRIPGKLYPKRIKGGIVLIEDYYTMK